jgi:hypothetical protein
MPLQFQTMQIPFSQGVDTKSDTYQIPMGKLLELENGIFSKAGAISKRNGYSLLSRNQIDNGKKITSAVTSATFNNNLLLMDNSYLYSYSQGTEGWANNGYLTSCQTTTTPVIHNASNQANPDGNYLNGIELYVYEDVAGGIYYSAIDYETKTFLAQGVQISATGFNPKVVTFGDSFYVVFAETSPAPVLKAALINSLSPSNIIIGTIAYDLSPIYTMFDVLSANSKIHVAYRNNDHVIIAKLDGLTLEDTYVTPYANPLICINLFYDSDNIWIAEVEENVAGPGCLINVFILSSITYTPAYIFPVYQELSQIRHITGICVGSPVPGYSILSNAIIYYETISGYDIEIKYIHYDFLNVSATLVSNSLIKKLALNNKVFKYNNTVYIPTVYVKIGTPATTQATNFLLDWNANIISKQNSGVASPRGNAMLAESIIISDGIYLFPELKQGELRSILGKLFTEIGVVVSKISFIKEDTVTNISWQPTQSSTLGNNLHLTGGVLHMFDGCKVYEHGFLLYPELSSTNFSISTGGFIAAGNYQYCFTYEWTDNFGQIHRSAPSIAVQVTSPANGLIVINVPTLTLTNKTGVRIVGYRTAEITTGSPIFYRFTSIVTPNYNDTSVATVAIIDDGTRWAQSNDVIYTTGGTLENIAAPSCALITSFKNRIFLSGSDDPNIVWFSKTIVPGEPVSFNDNLYIKLDNNDGPITGLGSMDNNLIIFKRNSIYVLTGEGPDNTGLNSDYLDPQSISSPVGCDNAASISETSQGVIFKSRKGIYQLNRGFGVDYIGAPVEEYNNQDIVSTVDVPTSHQIRILSSDGNALVYDYFFNQWSTFSNHLAASAGIWNNLFYFITPRGETYVENIGSYLDGNKPIPLKITTGWMNFSGVQGYSRIKDILILGHYKGVNTLSFSIRYNGDEYVDGSCTFDSNVLYNNIYGENFVFGDNGVFGGIFNLEQVRLFPNKQKVQSIKLTIEETDSGNEGIAFTGMNVTVGSKSTHAKINANNHKGAA